MIPHGDIPHGIVIELYRAEMEDDTPEVWRGETSVQGEVEFVEDKEGNRYTTLQELESLGYNHIVIRNAYSISIPHQEYCFTCERTTPHTHDPEIDSIDPCYECRVCGNIN